MASPQGSAPMPTPSAGGGPANAAAGPSRIAFVIPPPVTFFVQFQDGMQVAIAPTPVMLGVNPPVMGDLSFMMPALITQLLGGAQMQAQAQDDGMMRVLHELFMQAQHQGPPPTSKSFLDKLPMKIWSDKIKANEKQMDCPICLSDFEDDEQVISLPCNHLFHKECGLRWLVEHNVCPTCRHQLPTQQEEASNNTPTTEHPAPAVSTAPTTSEESSDQPTRASRTRPRSPVSAPIRVVRRRVEETRNETEEPMPEPATTLDEESLDSLLEEEANRLVAEEREAERTSAMDLENAMDRDAESLLQSNAPASSCTK